MTMKGVNIYKAARQRAHMTIETASEMLNVAPRSLQHYEAGDRETPDEIVAGMMQAYNAPYLGYQHLRASPVGKVILPSVRHIPGAMRNKNCAGSRTRTGHCKNNAGDRGR